MSATHEVLTIDGRDVADLIVCGHAVTIYTDCAPLLHLDGQSFRSLREARDAASRAMPVRQGASTRSATAAGRPGPANSEPGKLSQTG